MFNVAAAGGPGGLETALASWAVNASMFWRAPHESIPMEIDKTVLASGEEHYAAMCVYCHGAPDVAPAEFAAGLYPPPPSLTGDDMSDGELFWTIKNGIRMTGMPAFGATHSDEKIWHIVAFIRHLSELTPAEKETLQNARPESEEHEENEG